jgi:hypothetical protein
MGDENGVTLRDSIDTDGGGSAWKNHSIPYTREDKYGKRSDPWVSLLLRIDSL